MCHSTGYFRLRLPRATRDESPHRIQLRSFPIRYLQQILKIEQWPLPVLGLGSVQPSLKLLNSSPISPNFSIRTLCLIPIKFVPSLILSRVSFSRFSGFGLQIKSMPTKPVEGQKTTSGLRKKAKVFQEENYVANWIQALFNSLPSEDLKDGMLVLGDDGRHFNKEAAQIIIKIAAGNGVGKILVGRALNHLAVTIRVYIEQFEPDTSKHDLDAQILDNATLMYLILSIQGCQSLIAPCLEHLSPRSCISTQKLDKVAILFASGPTSSFSDGRE